MPSSFRPIFRYAGLIGIGMAAMMTWQVAVAQEQNVDIITTSSIDTNSPVSDQICGAINSAEVATLVHMIASELGFDPDLAEAVAFVESGLGQHQTSGAGAVGIMQLMPGTATDLGVLNRCDPAANIRGGITYLKSLYDEFQDPLLMLAAYNAGAGRVYEKTGIPEFEETAKYVVKVMNRWKLAAKVKVSGLPQLPDMPAIAPQSALSSDAPSPISHWKDNHVIEVQ